MDKNNHRRLLPAGLATCLLVALALPPEAFAGLCSRDPEPDVVDVDPINNAIIFSPLESFEAMVLSVTGPFEYSFVQEVGPDQNAVFQLDPPATADGCYTWEVRIDPILDGEILEALASARESGDYSQVRALMRSGELPDRARVQSGAFQVVAGGIVLGGGPPEGGEARAAHDVGTFHGTPEGPVCAARLPRKDYVINDDLIVDGSTCVGHDCFNGWEFSYTTLALSENNTRIKFDDTSYLASYPNNDWQLVANDSSNGGIERFSILDCGDNDAQGACSGGQVFTVEAGAPGAAFYLDDQGRVGFGTPTPYYELHVVDGDTPTLRLAQDGSLGFTPQSWDVAGNESSFFVRDATSGSKIPFRIKPGAPSNSLYIEADGDVGLGTYSPDGALHVPRNENDAFLVGLVLENTDSSPTTNSTGVGFRLETARGSIDINAVAQSIENEFRINIADGDGAELTLDRHGNLVVSGSVTPDYVFAPDYPLMPLAELAAFIEREGHLPNIPSAEESRAIGKINLKGFQMKLLEKVEELTLYTLAQQEIIQSQQAAIRELERRQADTQALERRLAALEEAGGGDR